MKKIIIDSVGRLDLVVWILVVCFFCGSSLLFDGDLKLSFLGASGIILEMLFISISIEIIIDSLKDAKGIGTLTGFITNGPEALCLLVGLFVGDIIFAASTPLGSNFMNPLLLIVAALVTGSLATVSRCRPLFTWSTIIITMLFAILFFSLDVHSYPLWIFFTLLFTTFLFFLRPKEVNTLDEQEEPTSKAYLLPAVFLLTATGYFLDSVVTFAADNSHTPKGVIGFLVLSTLTSWPEFKSCISLLQRKLYLSAILNITVSNITNLWLAVLGVTSFLLLK